MAGVDADTQAVALVGALQDPPQVRHAVAQARALPCRVLHQDPRAQPGRPPMDPPQVTADACQPAPLAGAHVRSGVQHQVADAQGLAAQQLLEDHLRGALRQLGVGAGQVGQVRRVGHDRPAQAMGLGEVEAGLLVVQGPPGPPRIVCSENLQCLGTVGFPSGEGVVHSPCDGFVSADEHGGGNYGTGRGRRQMRTPLNNVGLFFNHMYNWCRCYQVA